MAESMKGLKRSHRCTEVTKADIGSTVTLMGWVQKSRNKGGIVFVDLRDRSGIMQLIFENGSIDEEGFEKVGHLRSEFVIAVVGTVEKRSGAVNENHDRNSASPMIAVSIRIGSRFVHMFFLLALMFLALLVNNFFRLAAALRFLKAPPAIGFARCICLPGIQRQLVRRCLDVPPDFLPRWIDPPCVADGADFRARRIRNEGFAAAVAALKHRHPYHRPSLCRCSQQRRPRSSEQ